MEKPFFNQFNSSASGKRSSVLSPVIWFIGLFMTSILTGFKLGIPEYVLIIFITIFIIGCILFIGAYIYSFFKSPDHLRSESFIISKMKIEKGITGDQLTGQFNDEIEYSEKLISKGENES
jgi:hypothetical protein